MKRIAGYIVLVGNVVEGVTPFGPFADHDAASDWAKEAEFKELGIVFLITNLWVPS